MIYIQAWIKGDAVLAIESSDNPVSGGGFGSPHDYTVVACIDAESADPIAVYESLSIADGVLVSSLGDIVVMSQEESELLKWRATCKVTNFQAKAALMDADLLDSAEAAVVALGGKVKLSWDLEPTWSRMSNEINAIGAALGLEDDQIDALFKSAEMQ